MTTKQINQMATEALRCLRKAVQEELKRKDLLGQHVIINRKNKPYRISAKQAFKMTKAK